jgi:hypothetical protein
VRATDGAASPERLVNVAMQWTYASPGAPMRLKFTSPQLMLGIGDRGGLTVGNDATLTNGTRVTHYPSEQEPDAEGAAALETFAAQLAVRAWVDAESRFHLQAQDRSLLAVSAGGPWESWTFAAPDRGLVVCTPSGDLATWGPLEE